MKAQIWSYATDTLVDVRNVEISDEYDGDPYGDDVPFSVGSNQMIVVDEGLFREEF